MDSVEQRTLCERWSGWSPAVGATLLALALYAMTLKGTYIYDDVFIVLGDSRIKDPHRWSEFFRGAYIPLGVDNLYRPLTSLSFALQWWLHGDQPWAFHLVNILLHGAATAAVTLFVARLWGSWPAWIAGILFAVHPVHVEAVAGLVGRAESICTAATFCGLILCLRRPLSARRVVLIFTCFAIALLSKEQGLLFPLLVFLVVMLPHRIRQDAPPPRPDAAERSRRLWLAVLLIWAFAGYMVYRESILKFGWDRSRLEWWINPMIRSVGVDCWLMPLVLVGRYVVLLVAPVHLSLDYGADVIGSTVHYKEPYLYLGSAAVLIWVAGAVVAIRARSWRALFCLLGLALSYGMVSNTAVLIGTIMGERLMYLPSAFFLALVGGAAAKLPAGAARRAGIAVLVVVAGLGFARSITYAMVWNDRPALYEYNLARNPKSLRAYLLVFQERIDAKDWAGALQVAEASQRAFPKMHEPDFLAGWAHMELGHLDTAKAMLWSGSRKGAGDSTVGLWMEIEERQAAATRPAGSSTRPDKQEQSPILP
jgi:protein O-mannosyl-transferase